MPHDDKSPENMNMIRYIEAFIIMIVVPIVYVWYVRRFIKKMNL